MSTPEDPYVVENSFARMRGAIDDFHDAVLVLGLLSRLEPPTNEETVNERRRALSWIQRQLSHYGNMIDDEQQLLVSRHLRGSSSTTSTDDPVPGEQAAAMAAEAHSKELAAHAKRNKEFTGAHVNLTIVTSIALKNFLKAQFSNCGADFIKMIDEALDKLKAI